MAIKHFTLGNPRARLGWAVVASLIAHGVIGVIGNSYFAEPRGRQGSVRTPAAASLRVQVATPAPDRPAGIMRAVPAARKPALVRRVAAARSGAVIPTPVVSATAPALAEAPALADTVQAQADPTPGPLLSTQFEIEYAVSAAGSASPGGRAWYTWNMGAERYASTLSATGLSGGNARFELRSDGSIQSDTPSMSAASFGFGAGPQATVTPDPASGEQMQFVHGDELKRIPAGAFDPLSLARLLVTFSQTEVGMRLMLVDHTGPRMIRLKDLVDETIVVGAASMAARRFRFETDESKDAITIWLAPEQNWAPARLLLSTPDGMLTFDAISIRHGADESGQKRVSPAK